MIVNTEMKIVSEMNGGHNMDNEKLIKSIKELCQKNNISVSQLESKLNFSPSLISRWKNKNPNIDRIIDIAEYFHVSLDEVVGYESNINDTFLNTLYEQTSNGTIVWKDSRIMNKQGWTVKIHDDFQFPGEYIDDNGKEVTYATCFNSGYIAIYAYYIGNQILHPANLILFIQPSNNSFLVDQHYTKEELVSLWVKILNNLGDNAPDAVKAEDLKNEFILNHSLTNGTNTVSYNDNIDDIEKIVGDPSVMKLMEVYNKPEFQELQKVFNNPEFQMAMRTANKLQKYFEKLNVNGK